MLISHASKVLIKILQPRLQEYMSWELLYVQVGFRKGRGIRDQIANICWITEKERGFKKKRKSICFVDYWKAFDCADHSKLWKVLKEMVIPDHLTCPLRNLYAEQEAIVITLHGTTDWYKIFGKEICQDSLLSPCWFNFYAEYIMWNARRDDSQAGIKIAERNSNNLRFVNVPL